MARRIPVPTKRRQPTRSPEYAFSPMSPDDDNTVSPMLLSSGSPVGGEFARGAPEIAPTEIKRGKKLGKGSFATVYAGMCRGMPVAVKVLNETPHALASEEGRNKLRDEMAVHQRLYHPNIVLFMGACTSGDRLMIVQELMHKDLERVLFDPELKLSLGRRVEFGQQVARGMNWLHMLDPPVLHRDLKPSNCLLDREMTHVKIADFGLSAILAGRAPLKDSCGPRGTANYLAPEVLMGRDVTTAADVYAFGVLLWQLWKRLRPYDDLGTISFDGFADFICDEGNRPDIADPERTEYPMLVDLIERCWASEPADRPPFSEVCDVLSEAVVEIAVPHDSDAQSFWLKFFPNSTGAGVKIERVVRALLKWYRLPLGKELQPRTLQQQIQHLELLLREDDSADESAPVRPRVTLDWFGQLVSWVGPLDGDFFKRVGTLCSRPWFHGHLSSAQAARLLNGRADGFFLVRFSGTEAGFFCVSYVRGGKVAHVRIEHQPCALQYRVATAPGQTVRPWHRSLQDLIDKERDFLLLTLPCPGSRFAPELEVVSGYLGISPQLIETSQ